MVAFPGAQNRGRLVVACVWAAHNRVRCEGWWCAQWCCCGDSGRRVMSSTVYEVCCRGFDLWCVVNAPEAFCGGGDGAKTAVACVWCNCTCQCSIRVLIVVVAVGEELVVVVVVAVGGLCSL